MVALLFTAGRPSDSRVQLKQKKSEFSIKIYVMDTQKNHLNCLENCWRGFKKSLNFTHTCVYEPCSCVAGQISLSGQTSEINITQKQ